MIQAVEKAMKTSTVKSCIKATAYVQFFNFFCAASIQMRLLCKDDLNALSVKPVKDARHMQSERATLQMLQSFV